MPSIIILNIEKLWTRFENGLTENAVN